MDEKDQGDLIAKLQEAANSGNPISVKGNKYMATWPWRAETRYLIQSVEPLSK